MSVPASSTIIDSTALVLERLGRAQGTTRATPPDVATIGGSLALDRSDVLAIELLELALPTRDFVVEVADWRVERGACIALIGPNGAGKTTIIEALLGLRKARALRCRMLGLDIASWRRQPKLRHHLGVLLQRASLPLPFRVTDVLNLHRRLYRHESERVMEELGVAPLRKKVYGSLSRGERQRVDLWMALAHEPALAFLDEPFTGLDKQHAEAMADLVRHLTRTTIVMACHSPEELALASAVAWIHRGKIRAYEPPDALRRKLIGDYRLQVSFTNTAAAENFGRQLAADIRPQFTKAHSPVRISVYGSEALVQLARTLVDDAQVDAVEFGRTSYADLLYRCSLGDADA